MSDFKPLVRKFDPLTCLRFIAVTTPASFRNLWLTSDSPSTHRLIIDLVESARKEEFIEELVDFFKKSQPKDCQEIFNGLVARFAKKLPSQQQSSLDSTLNDELRAKCMNKLGDKDASRLILARDTL